MFTRLILTAAVTSVCLINTPYAFAVPPLHTAQAESRHAPLIRSNAVLVVNAETGEPVFEKNADISTPIASITKLMTAMVLLDSQPDMDQFVTISDSEIDHLKKTTSRLAVGTTLSRYEMLLLALMSSENRAAASLARTAPGGTAAFVQRMNQKARDLGMTHTVFYDPTGLNSGNASTAADLAKMVAAAYRYPLIRQFTTTAKHEVYAHNRLLHYMNSNALVREGQWDIGLSKTGYIQEAGRCLVMRVTVGAAPLIVVLLDSSGSAARLQDARQLKTWLERQPQTWMAG